MSEWIVQWGASLVLFAAWIGSAWFISMRRRRWQAVTRVCPTCQGAGRIGLDGGS